MSVVHPAFPDHHSPFSREQERARKRQAIVSAAARLFDRHGVHATRLEDIAADLGVTKTSISYYFASKEELVANVYLQRNAFVQDAIAAASAASHTGAPPLIALIEAYTDQWMAVLQGERPYVASLNDLNALGATAHEQVRDERDTTSMQTLHCVDQWRTATGAGVARSEPAAMLMLTLLDWVGVHMASLQPAPALHFRRALLDILRAGFAHQVDWRSGPLHIADLMDAPPEVFDRDARNRMKRDAFLKAGARLFNQKGFSGVSLGEIAASLGVTRGALYYHISDKEALLEQCLERSYDIIQTVLERAETVTGPRILMIERARRVLVSLQISGVAPLLRPHLVAALPQHRQRRFTSRLRNVKRWFGDVLSQAVADGETTDMDVEVAEELLINVVFLNRSLSATEHTLERGWLTESPLEAPGDYVYILFSGLEPTHD